MNLPPLEFEAIPENIMQRTIQTWPIARTRRTRKIPKEYKGFCTLCKENFIINHLNPLVPSAIQIPCSCKHCFITWEFKTSKLALLVVSEEDIIRSGHRVNLRVTEGCKSCGFIAENDKLLLLTCKNGRLEDLKNLFQ